jgi:G:T-mismatch repair DNA endonuclease (very short patch repair protein)
MNPASRDLTSLHLTSRRSRSVRRYLQAARCYARTHGDLTKIASRTTVAVDGEEVRLGPWLVRVRDGAVHIDMGTRQALTELGMRWEPHRKAVARRHLRAARQYADAHGGLRTARQHTTVDVDGTRVRLGAWLDRVRSGDSPIDDDIRSVLTALGMRWDMAKRPSPEDFLRAARAHAAAHGSLAGVRHDTVVDVDGTQLRLGGWLSRVRGGRSPVTPEQRSVLTDLGMRWRPGPGA